MVTPDGADQALAGITVLELGEWVAGPFCTKLLAGYGATVIKIEPPRTGDPSRDAGLSPEGGIGIGGERSPLYLYLNTDKQSVALNLQDAADRARLRALARRCDILVENYQPGYLDRLGLGYEELKAGNPRLVYVSLSAFGRTGPWAHWQTTNLVSLAAGGQLQLTGDADREPLKPGGEQADYQLGLNGFGAALAGFWDAQTTGLGQQIEISAQEAMASTLELALNSYIYAGKDVWPRRRGNVASATIGLYPCLDGYIGVHAMPRNFAPLLQVMEMDSLIGDERFSSPAGRLANNDELTALIYGWAAGQRKRDAYERAGSMRGPISFVHDMAGLFGSPQLQARHFLREIDHPVAGRLTYPGAPFQMSLTPARAGRAPLLGEHTAAVLGALASDGARRAASSDASDAAFPAVPDQIDGPPSPAVAVRPLRPLPLAGVRIADLTAVWAGPYATRLLADMGAEVIKVESAASPDLLRALSMQPPDTPRAYNRSAYFNHNNRNKYGCSLDLASKAGRAVFLDLVKSSDVVIENFRADVLDKLGLGYDVLCAARPDIVLISMPGHGKTGPEAGYIAYGTNVEQLAGLVSITGYAGDVPHKSGISYGDPVSGTLAAGAVMTALLYRRRTGKGQFIDLAQREALTALIGEFVVQYSMTGAVPGPSGNDHPLWAPHGVFPCAGDDQWVAVVARDDAEFAALCRTIERPELAGEPRYAGREARHEHRAELNGPITAWTAHRPPLDAATVLQAAGVPAGPVESYRELVDEDPQLRARGFFEEVTHREAGTWRMERPVWRFGDAPAHIRINGPMFAEHNEYVYRALLGLDGAAIEELSVAGVIGDEPNFAAHGGT